MGIVIFSYGSLTKEQVSSDRMGQAQVCGIKDFLKPSHVDPTVKDRKGFKRVIGILCIITSVMVKLHAKLNPFGCMVERNVKV